MKQNRSISNTNFFQRHEFPNQLDCERTTRQSVQAKYKQRKK
jgi:hypothetical protein